MRKMYRFIARSQEAVERLHQVGRFLGIPIQSDPDDFSGIVHFVIATPKQALQLKQMLPQTKP